MEVVSERPWATVWRDGELWRKQCNSIWTFEVPLTVALAARWPDRLPEVIDHGDDWMVLRDAGELVTGHATWVDGIARYAELQRGEVERVDEHLANGVPDQRNALLPAFYADMLERDELPWRGDERERFRRFERRFTELCGELEDVASINHDDLHHHNMYEGPRILDWGDSCLSHPFFSLVVTFNFVKDGQDEIRDAYLEGYGGDRETFALALRVGKIAHLFKWIRFRDALPAPMLPQYDDWMRDFLEPAVAQTIE